MKVNYSFTALTPLFTGSDENSGTLRTLRREKRLLANPVVFKSVFKNKIERTKALMNVVFPVYQNIDKSLKSDHYGFYEAYANKTKAALAVENKKQFLNKLLESCGIPVLADGTAQLVRESMDKFSDVEFLETMREEHQYLMIILREYVAWCRSNEGKQIGAQMSIWEQQTEPLIEEIEFIKNFENVPYFGGNSIRGYLRRVMMYDYCKLAGIAKMNKDTYHQLFTGGNITDSTGFEDIAKREKYIEMCPAIGLLGSAIGNMTIEGEMKVIGARLRCKENGTGDLSFWQLIEQNFGTRLDSSKREKEIEIVNNTEQKSQMIYQYENFITGSVFDSAFVLTTTDELMLSAFWRMMKLWKENNFIGGNSARDSGMIEFSMDIPENADAKYLEYISAKSEEIKEYFNAVG
jgi:hypothetical protein